MFANLTRKLFGDNRPIERQVENQVLGTLAYSDEDDAWLTSEEAGSLQFGFYIVGSEDLTTRTRKPDPGLVKQAETFALAQNQFVAEVMAYVQSESKSRQIHKGWELEIAALKIETLCLFWPKRPRDAQISFSGGSNHRLWRCGYLDGKPGGGLSFDS
jgi:hypothetical protein